MIERLKYHCQTSIRYKTADKTGNKYNTEKKYNTALKMKYSNTTTKSTTKFYDN